MKYVFIAGAVILTAFIIVLQFIPLGIEPLTELYFEDHINLPKDVNVGEAYNFSFTINNLEYQNMAYIYRVEVFTDNELMEVIETERISIQDNESLTINETFMFAEEFNRSRIQVSIEKDHLNITPDFKKKLWWPDPNYPNEIDIHFWIE